MVMYKQFIELIRQSDLSRKIIVTGPQRSGTRIASQMIASDLYLDFIDERKFGATNFEMFLKVIKSHTTCVIQAPDMSAQLSLLRNKEIVVVYMIRDIQDIIKSEKRIGWDDNSLRIKYKKYFPGFYDDKKPISQIKYEVWNEKQKYELVNPFFEIQYESLKDHKMWVNKENRKNFKWHQTA